MTQTWEAPQALQACAVLQKGPLQPTAYMRMAEGPLLQLSCKGWASEATPETSPACILELCLSAVGCMQSA